MQRTIEIPFHIGDFLTDTMGMSATEIGAYMMLCVAHYQAGENGIPDDDIKLARIGKVSQKVWKKIRPIVTEKFYITDGFLRSKTVIESLQKKNSRISNAKAKALKRWDSVHATASPQQCHGNANQGIVYNNKYNKYIINPLKNIPLTDFEQKASPEKHPKASNILEKPETVTAETWADFLALRKSHKAPLTETALKGVQREADKAGWDLERALRECCLRGWRGFKAEWVQERQERNERNGRRPEKPDRYGDLVAATQDAISRMAKNRGET
jgi:uncharacterized protein YdaU (DUF1376 family)